MKNLVSIIFIILLTGSCMNPDFAVNEQQTLPVEEILQAPENFDWSTEARLAVTLSQRIHKDGVMVYAFEKGDEELRKLSSWYVGNKTVSSTLTVSSNLDSVFFSTNMLGYTDLQGYSVHDQLALQFIPRTAIPANKSSTSARTSSRLSNIAQFSYLGNYDSNGVPDNLEEIDDQIDQSLLDDVGASLPEGFPVPTYNPDYISNRNLDSRILENADVWVTFVHEGAGWKNALGFYTYDLDAPPQSVEDIEIFNPELSLEIKLAQKAS